MKTRFIKAIGTRISLRIFNYTSDVPEGTCAHDASIVLRDVLHEPNQERKHLGGEPEDYIESMWPKKCGLCGGDFVAGAKRQVFNRTLYNTPSGRPEPGDLFYAKYFTHNNHEGPALIAILPNGREWNIDSRASNCTMPEDQTHRCWVRHGSPEDGTIQVDKAGHTCQAGAGSILVGDFHGFLHNGNFTSC